MLLANDSATDDVTDAFATDPLICYAKHKIKNPQYDEIVKLVQNLKQTKYKHNTDPARPNKVNDLSY